MSTFEDRSSDPADLGALLELDDSAAARRAQIRRAAWIAGGVLALLFAAWWIFGGDDGALTYTTQPTQIGDLTVTVTATGTLQPTNQVDVGSELSGTIRSVAVDFNDSVTVGEVLAKLDTTRLDAQVLQSKAALDAAQARLGQTQATVVESDAQLARLERVREISGGKVPSQQELDAANAIALRARSEVASARAAIAQAKATLDTQETDLGKAEIRSPIDGIVLLRAAEPGQTVAASLQAPILFTLAQDLTRMELHVSVDEADVGQVSEGQEATFTVDAWPDRTFTARVAQVRFGSTITEGVGVVTYETILEVDNAERLLRPGMTATAEITVKKVAQALLVPNAALRFKPPAEAAGSSGGLLRAFIPGRPGRGARRPSDDGTKSAREESVYLLDDGVPKAVTVEVGASDGGFTEVTPGTLEPGTELIVDAVAKKS
jgi:HlyD family secretion protein